MYLMEPTTADGSPLVVKSRGWFIPMEWRIFLWPPKRDVSLATIVKELSDPALYERHCVSSTMMMSDDECHLAAKRIEEEAFNAYADETAEIESGLHVFTAYWSKIRIAIITTVKSRGPRSPSPNPRDFIPMEETEPKVYHNRDENDRNDEIDGKKAKLLEEGGAKSRPAPQKGMVRREFGICKNPYLSDDEESGIANLLASEAVKEYNNRQFEDKLELVKVTKEIGSGAVGYLYNLTFDAKVLGDGGGGRTKTYQAGVWLKIDGTLQVISFKLTDDGQGKEVWFWERR